ncbi:MAG: hypothetical protein RMI39_03445, partial [Thermoanaerobaculum sp.]|nr:hypothetical protein [Thermoanaerobaculum sp.]
MVGLVLAAAVACPLHPTSLDVVLGTRALPGLPPDLARQLAKHPREFHQGAEAAAAYPQVLHSVGAGVTLEETLLAQCDRLVAAIRSRATFASVTAGFGALAHLVLDLYFPPPPTAPAEAQADSSVVL